MAPGAGRPRPRREREATLPARCGNRAGGLAGAALVAMAIAGLAFAAAALAGCSPSGRGRMVSGDPPEGWAEQIAERREERNHFFRQDPESPLLPADLASFTGLEYWPPDPALRFVGPIHLNEAPTTFQVPTTAGRLRPCEKYGWLSFVVDGQVCILQVYRLLDSDVTGTRALFLPFADLTSGRETYPAGRYVSLEQNDGGDYVLDFNLAYNPSCAYGAPERFACPVTPPANRLPVRIEAGERGYKDLKQAGPAT